MPPAGITLRPQTEDDFEFMAELYASTREEELRDIGWTDDFKRTFLRAQFEAQWAHYSEHYHDASFRIIERNGERIGRLYTWQNADDLRIVDIALMPHARGAGIGSALLRELMDDAAGGGRSVSIHVERFNPALHLYQRLGFEHVDEHGVYYLMKWRQPKIA
jgi:ribosomal protein S18 acetylase RimI-like enzyme